MSAVRTRIEDMYKKWIWGDKIEDEARLIFQQIEQCKSDPASPNENIFILISRIIPQKNRICFTVALLVEAKQEMIILPNDDLDWTCWLTIYDCSILQELRHSYYPLGGQLFHQLDDGIGPDAVKLILNAFAIFGGEILLSNLKRRILRRCRREENFDTPRDEYMAVLDKLQARELQVDKKWYKFLGRMLSWETPGPDFFLAAWGDSDISDDDPTEPEDEGMELRTPRAIT